MGRTDPNDNDIQNNTIADVSANAHIGYSDLNASCGTTQFLSNLVLIPIDQAGTVCTATNNGSTAPGRDANELFGSGRLQLRGLLV